MSHPSASLYVTTLPVPLYFDSDLLFLSLEAEDQPILFNCHLDLKGFSILKVEFL